MASRYLKTDDVLWKKHLERIGVTLPPGQPVRVRVDGSLVDFVPMRAGAPGWRAEGPGRSAWVAIPKGTEVLLELESAPAGGPGPVVAGAEGAREFGAGAPCPEGRGTGVGEFGPSRDAPGADGDGLYVGIDVGGRVDKGYDVCPSLWRDGRPVQVEFHRLPHGVALPPTAELREAVAAGRFEELAERTFRAAEVVAANLWRALEPFRPAGVFIDASSAFARNAAGHGRYTEKFGLAGVSFQPTPSVACARPHGGDWGWLVYGMIAFAACVYRGEVTLERWHRGLVEGFDRACRSGELHVREVFPTATVQTLRHGGRAAEVTGLLAGLGEEPAVERVRRYLAQGVWGNKARSVLSDRADALVAALGALPCARADFSERILGPAAGGPVTWRAAVADARELEGAVVVPG